jgi:CRISPR-associated protein Cmr1
MFSGGADPNSGPAELREQSFKGVLRYWWRACARSNFRDLGEVRREEMFVFGGPAGERDIGRSRVTIRIEQPKGSMIVGNGRQLDVGVGGRYLGYGLLDEGRSCIRPPFALTVDLGLRGLSEGQRNLVVEALRALGTLGGMGARSRRGYGSLSLAAISIDKGSIDALRGSPTELRAAIDALARDSFDGLPEYTALSSASRFLVGRPRSNGLGALDEIGQEYKEFRKFADDGQDMRATKRAAFGLPVNVGKAKTVVTPVGHKRRGSPLFFHIHECAGQSVGVVSFLPARFLPDARIAIGPQRTVRLPEEAELYQSVHGFLDHLSRPGGPFQSVTEVN